ncbi:hypothetical protein LEP1GSC073_3992 [Leptospira noguchii str. Cascata]|nr:hypothetical protein LEP1GSC073_3992 [Leptospira noguchii str. Cascata]
MKKSGKPGPETGSDHAHQTKAWRTKILSSSKRISKQIQIL